jgi:biopolymer transport protein ExbD
MWKIRHEGSPQYAETTLDAIRQELADGAWEATDEVMGPGETEWVAIENHPQLEELALDLEPPPSPHYDDETRLDMTALIDVCLVLLVFFILTTTVAALQVRLEAPTVDDKNKVNVKAIKMKDVEESMILCRGAMINGQLVIKVEDDVVEMPKLAAAFRNYARGTKKTTLLLDLDDKVTHEVQVKVIDAAKGAGLERVHLVVAEPKTK